MVAVDFDDLSLAFDFVSAAAPMEHRAYVALDTGKIYWISELAEIEEEAIPDDLSTSDRYLEIPHKNDLDLGQRLVFRFIEARLPHQHDRVANIFRHRGAYRRFKELLAAADRLEEWRAFAAEATANALREWCQENDLHPIEREKNPSD